MTEHCGTAWAWLGDTTTWEGKPGEGYTITERKYGCVACKASMTVILREPS